MTRGARAAVAAVALAASAAQACGVCIDDKVAAAYDHAVVEQARVRGQVVVFAEVRGRGAPAQFVGVARKAAARVPGVVARSVRAAEAPAALSFALDDGAVSPGEALAAVEEGALAAEVSLTLLKVMR